MEYYHEQSPGSIHLCWCRLHMILCPASQRDTGDHDDWVCISSSLSPLLHWPHSAPGHNHSSCSSVTRRQCCWSCTSHWSTHSHHPLCNTCSCQDTPDARTDHSRHREVSPGLLTIFLNTGCLYVASLSCKMIFCRDLFHCRIVPPE